MRKLNEKVPGYIVIRTRDEKYFSSRNRGSPVLLANDEVRRVHQDE